MTAEYQAGRNWRIARIVICFATLGFVFPSALRDVEEERVAAMVPVRK